MFLILCKKGGRLIDEEKCTLHQKIREIAGCVFGWYKQKYTFLSEKNFFDFKLIKGCSGHHFYYFLFSCDKYINYYF